MMFGVLLLLSCSRCHATFEQKEVVKKQHKISQIIRETLHGEDFDHPEVAPVSEMSSSIHPFCPDEEKYLTMSACCSSSDKLYNLENVKVLQHKFVGFSRTKEPTSVTLPPIRSIFFQNRVDHTITMSFSRGSFRQQACLEYFDGTLHVVGSVTTNNLYHAGL
jgi:hypothetical protein